MKSFYSKQTKQRNKQNNKVTMSSINNIVNILSAKYGFDAKEAAEYVKAEIQAYKNMTKEEKDAIKEAQKLAEKQAKAAAKAAVKEAVKAITKQEREAKKAEKASKPKAPRTPAQEAAFQKMIAANKAKRAAKLALPPPENSNYFVTFQNVNDPEEMSFIEENYKLEFMEHVQQITNTLVVPLENIHLSDYAKFIKTYPDTEFDSVGFCNGQPSQMNYTFVFQDEEYQAIYHKI